MHCVIVFLIGMIFALMVSKEGSTTIQCAKCSLFFQGELGMSTNCARCADSRREPWQEIELWLASRPQKLQNQLDQLPMTLDPATVLDESEGPVHDIAASSLVLASTG